MEVPDDIPDLDDMSELVEGIKLNQQKKPQQQPQPKTLQQNLMDKPDNGDIKDKDIPPPLKSKDFGGMKKGFLFGGGAKSSKPKSKPPPIKTKDTTDIITPVNDPSKQKNPLVLDEVQDAMKGDRSWITEDLLKQVESNDKLSKQLSDPKIARAINMMQKDPKSAMEYYKNDMEVQTFFKEFYGILGQHFTKLGAEQPQNPNAASSISSADEKAMQDILSNSEIRDILTKPAIQKLIGLLRNDPDEAQKFLNSNDASFRADVNKLVSAGVLAFQQ